MSSKREVNPGPKNYKQHACSKGPPAKSHGKLTNVITKTSLMAEEEATQATMKTLPQAAIHWEPPIVTAETHHQRVAWATCTMATRLNTYLHMHKSRTLRFLNDKDTTICPTRLQKYYLIPEKYYLIAETLHAKDDKTARCRSR
mmetsp:Transcript_93443/g.147012  ORF Transcript_93443/g.147012 Transcript_93443/m.147012 type:complete len:144 (-) Transcript_93443:507-938(-)